MPRYSALAADADPPPPIDPPDYAQAVRASSDLLAAELEEFELDEPANPHRLFLTRAQLATRKLALDTRLNLVTIRHQFDPVFEWWVQLDDRFDAALSKVGNTFVLRRVLAVAVVGLLVLVVTLLLAYTLDQLGTGGTFSNHGELLQIMAGDVVSRHDLEQSVEYFASMPRMPGSAADHQYALYVQGQFKAHNLQGVHVHEFASTVQHPLNESLYLRVQGGESFVVAEPGGGDHGLAFASGLRPGKASSQKVVFANFGTDKDYAVLQTAGVDVADAVVLVQYGMVHPSQKLIAAAKHKAAAVVLIPDTDTGVHAVRVNVALPEGDEIPSTPCLPVLAATARRLFALMAGLGPSLDALGWGWAGETVLVGGTLGNNKRLELSLLAAELPDAPMWNVNGYIEGREQSKRRVVVGASRDLLCGGAVSASGHAVMLEVMQVLHHLYTTKNWRPLRSIQFVLFAGGSANRAGVVEHVSGNPKVDRQEEYAFIDLDNVVGGDTFEVECHPALHPLVSAVLHMVRAQGHSETLAQQYFKGLTPRFPYLTLTDSSMYVMQTRGGTPAVRIRYTGKAPPEGLCQDTFAWFTENVDGDMTRHHTMVETVAKLAFKLADDPLIPFGYDEYVRAMAEMMRGVQQRSLELHMQLNFKQAQLGYTKFLEVTGRYQQWAHAWKNFVYNEYSVDATVSAAEPTVLLLNRWDWNDRMVLFEDEIVVAGPRHQVLWGGTPQRYDNHGLMKLYAFPGVDSRYPWNVLPEVQRAIATGDQAHAQQVLDKEFAVVAEAASRFYVN